jgi:OOP family OmpA-OmpF porin
MEHRMRLLSSAVPASVRIGLLALLLLGIPTFAPPTSAAQGEFDDEFDEEFEEEEREETPRAPARGRAAAGDEGDLADDEFADDTADDDETPTEADAFEGVPTEQERAPAASGSRARGGDLLRDRASDEWRDRRFVLHNTWGGPVGGIHVVDAGGGPSESFRAQLLTDFFFANGFLEPNDNHAHIGGSLSISWSPWDFLEIYASLESYASSTDASESPQLFQVLGDSVLGLKGYYEVLPFLILGGDLQVALLNTVGDIGIVGDSTSFGIRANATLDLRGLPSPIPLISRLNFQYYLDRSQALVESVEQARYNALPTTGPDARQPIYRDEVRNLLTRFERRSLGINRTDFFNIGIGFEAPLTVMQDFTISPILEWNVSIPVNSRSYSCLDPRAPGTDIVPPGSDDCLDFTGFDAIPSTLTIGVRVMPPFRGLSITAAVDIGTSGMSTFVRELSPNAPYDVILGFGYAFDAVPQVEEIEREVERRVEVRIPPPVRGRIIGTVVEQGVGTAIPGVQVTYVGRDFTPQSTAADGRFVSYEVDPGDVVVDLAHPQYNSGRCQSTVTAEGGDVEVRCELVALPRLGHVRGTVRSDSGSAVSGATVNVTGPQPFSVITDASGLFVRNDLQPGTYTARVDAEGYLITQESFEIRASETATPEITAIARPRQSLVSLRAREIIIRRQVNFATDSAEILPDSTALLTEIADTMLRHPEIRRVEIQGHTDSNGDDAHNMDLSQRRAESVRTWLIGAGVEAERLTAQGHGETRPLVPNITAANRARNRRVQFMIQERGTP